MRALAIFMFAKERKIKLKPIQEWNGEKKSQLLNSYVLGQQLQVLVVFCKPLSCLKFASFFTTLTYQRKKEKEKKDIDAGRIKDTTVNCE